MDESEFRRLLDHFPVVRSRSYCADSCLPNESSSKAAEDEVNEWQNAWAEVDQMEGDSEDQFWQKLRLAAEIKLCCRRRPLDPWVWLEGGIQVGPVEAERFCNAFHRVHKKLVSEELSMDAIQRFVDAAGSTRC